MTKAKAENGKKGHTFEFKNAACIHDFKLEMPEPGVYELHGANGVGKSSVQRAIARGFGQKQFDVPLRRGATEGYVKYDGSVLLRIGKVNRQSGRADISMVSSSPVADFIEPGLKDPEAAARVRVQSLLSIIDPLVTEDSIKTLVGANDAAYAYLDEQVGVDTLIEDDLVTAADKVRRLIHQLKQHWLREADQASARMTANQPEKPPVVVDKAVADAQAEYETAVRALERVSGEADQRKKTEATRKQIQENHGERPDVSADEQHVTTLEASKIELDATILELEKQLSAAKAQRLGASTQLDDAKGRVKQATAAAEAWDKNKALLAADVDGANDLDVQIAQKAVDRTRRTVEVARASEAYRAALEAYDTAQTEKDTATTLAREFESIAVNVTGKLGTLLLEAGLEGMTVEDGEVKLLPPDGRAVAELSYGERAALIYKPFVAKNPDSIVNYPAEHYSQLDIQNKADIARLTIKYDLYAVAEICDEGPLRVEKVEAVTK